MSEKNEEIVRVLVQQDGDRVRVVRGDEQFSFELPAGVPAASQRFGQDFVLVLVRKGLLAELRKFAKRSEKSLAEFRRLFARLGFDRRLATGGKPSELEKLRTKLRSLSPAEKAALREELELSEEVRRASKETQDEKSN